MVKVCTTEGRLPPKAGVTILPPRTHQLWDIPNLLSAKQAQFSRIQTAIACSHALQCSAKVKNMWGFTPFSILDLFPCPVKGKCLIPGFHNVVY